MRNASRGVVTFLSMLLAAPSALAEAPCKAASSPSAAAAQAGRVIVELRDELATVEDEIRDVPFVDALEAGEAPVELLRALAGEQYSILRSDLRSMAVLVARVPPEHSAFFQGLLEGERIAIGLLLDYAAALGWDEDDLAAYEPRPKGQTYPSFVAAMAAYGTQSDAAAAFLVNFPVFGENTGRVAAALRDHYGLDAEATAFFDFFAAPIPGFEESALAVIAGGFERGDCERQVRRTARLLQSYELDFWQAVGEPTVD